MTAHRRGFGGDYLYFEFDGSAGPSECIYSVGRFGRGRVFMVDAADGRVKLAGINSLVDGNFSYTQAGPFFPWSNLRCAGLSGLAMNPARR